MSRLPLTYCSFADPDRCLGVLILDGELDPMMASMTAHLLGLNPGGELLAVTVPADAPDRFYQAALENRCRLLSPWEARELLEGKSIREWEAELGETHGPGAGAEPKAVAS